jgi:type I restriction enzyme M protein
MSADASRIVGKLWSYCNVLRDDGLSYGDYLEQLTYLLFLKMADEQTRPPWKRPSPVPSGWDWPSLVALDGAALETHYRETLEHLGRQHGLLGLVFRKAQNKVQDPAKLKRLVADLIDKEQWVSLGADVKGDAYEGLLERNAQDTKSGAGQYFTPRPLIDAMVACVAPRPGERIVDPACGTGGFLLAAHRFVAGSADAPHPLTREQREHLRLEALRGVEIVQGVTRLCAMNLLLHNVGPTPQELERLRAERIAQGDTPEQADAAIERRLPVRTDDALRQLGNDRYDVVLTNPPFGRKSSILVVGEEGDTARESITYEREDFCATTTNKQLNFVQHVKSLLAVHGRAAVVVPDNVLFEGGAGETVRRKLLAECDVHTLLRLPTGIFYAQGVKANVLFFDRKPASPDPWTRRLWVYDLRTNQHFTLKTNPLRRSDLAEFESLYAPSGGGGEGGGSGGRGRDGSRAGRQATWSEANPEGRWRAYDYAELVARDKCSLDLFWLRDESLLDAENLPAPEEIAAEIAEDLRGALEQIEEILADVVAGRASE